MKRRTFLILLTLIALTSSGCDRDERVESMAKHSLDCQAEQNKAISDQAQAITLATSDLLDAETQARQELIALQQQLAASDAKARQELLEIQDTIVQRDADGLRELNDLQEQAHAAMASERQMIGQQRSELEAERRQIARERQRAPVVAAAITQVGLMFCCLLPLILCGYLLHTLRNSQDSDAAVTELLLHEIVAERPRLLSPTRSPALVDDSSSAEA